MIAEKTIDTSDWWPIELETKPDFEMIMKRIYAWHEQEIIDRPPVRFIAHNAAFNIASSQERSPEEWKQMIKKVQAAGKSIIVDLKLSELDDFIAVMDSPKGIYLWIDSSDEDEQLAIIKRLEKWL